MDWADRDLVQRHPEVKASLKEIAASVEKLLDLLVAKVEAADKIAHALDNEADKASKDDPDTDLHEVAGSAQDYLESLQGVQKTVSALSNEIKQIQRAY